MSLSMAAFTYLNAWWISLFLVLPFSPEPGRWKKKIVAVSVVAAMITGGIALLLESGLVPLRDTL